MKFYEKLKCLEQILYTQIISIFFIGLVERVRNQIRIIIEFVNQHKQPQKMKRFWSVYELTVAYALLHQQRCILKEQKWNGIIINHNPLPSLDIWI